MPARSDKFPWPSHYGHFDFFEARMKSHSDVASLKRNGNGSYELLRQSGKTLKVFICECYAFGVADYLEVVENLGSVDAVIINSNWCGYSPDAKRYCREQRVGLFDISDFMAALNRDDHWSYLNKGEVEYFQEKGWL